MPDVPLSPDELGDLNAKAAEFRSGLVREASLAHRNAATIRAGREGWGIPYSLEYLDACAVHWDARSRWWREQVATFDRTVEENPPSRPAPDAALRVWATYCVRGYSGRSDRHFSIAALRSRWRRVRLALGDDYFQAAIPEPLGRRVDDAELRGEIEEDRGRDPYSWPLDWPGRRQTLMRELIGAARRALRAPTDATAVDALAAAAERADALYSRDPLLVRTEDVLTATAVLRMQRLRAALDAEHAGARSERRRASAVEIAEAATFFVPRNTIGEASRRR